jgi:hypothetical protein
MFLPAYMVDMTFKDEHGNTNIEAAKKHYWKELDKIKDDVVAYRGRCMHAPLLISHMWVSDQSKLMPVEEARNREKELLKQNKYMELGTPTKLIWNSSFDRGIEARADGEAKPIINPFTKGSDTLFERKGCVMIYEKPVTNKYGEIYPDQYFYMHDPYISISGGESLQATFVVMNPKYITEGYNGNCIVATYIGKPELKGEYLDIMEKLIQYYGNCPSMLWYEANAGADVRNHFINKHKQHVLCVRPQLAEGKSIYHKNIRDTGYVVGNLVSKIRLIDNLSDWLRQTTELNGETKMNIERIPCLYTIRQIILFNLDDNFDGVDALLGLPLAIAEYTSMYINEVQKKNSNNLAYLSSKLNPNISNERKKIKEWNQKMNPSNFG